MPIYNKALVEDVRAMPGAKHTFLKQVCATGASRYRNAIEALVDPLAAPLANRASELLTSLDNRRFFQGHAEVLAATLLSRGAFRPKTLTKPGPMIVSERLNGQTLNLMVTSFIFKHHPPEQDPRMERLLAALNRVSGDQRFMVVVRRWKPEDLDLERIRRAVDFWLERMDDAMWDGRYATYEDDRVHLEFGVTGERAAPGSARVACTMGPFLSPASIASIEARTVAAMSNYVHGPRADTPLILACVADRPWAITPGYLRDFLYGKPTWQACVPDNGGPEFGYADTPAPCLFRHPAYHKLSGVLLLGRDPNDPTRLTGSTFLNPWADLVLNPSDVPMLPVMTTKRIEDELTVLSWQRRDKTSATLL